MREAENPPFERYEFGPFRVQVATRELHRGEAPLHAQTRVFDLLVLLLKNRDRVLSRDDLMQQLWPRAVVSPGALSQTVLKLRMLLGGEAESQQWISTIRGVGYRFTGQASLVHPMPQGGRPRPEPAARRGTAQADAGSRAIAVHRLAREHIIRSDYDAYLRDIARLSDRSEFGFDLRARVLALLSQSVRDRREDYAKAWHTLQRAEQLMGSLDCPVVKLMALQAKGAYFSQFVSQSEALPFYAGAMDIAKDLPDLLYASESAFHLAAAFGLVGDEAGCVKWGEDAIAYASRVEPPFIRTAMLLMVAGTRVRLGETALASADSNQAARHFSAALQLLDDAEGDGDAQTLRFMAHYLLVNRAFAEANLDPARRANSIETFRVLLGQGHRPVVRLDCMIDMGRLLRDAGRLDEAEDTCQQALEFARTSGIVRARESILLLAADIAKRKGQLGIAVLRLHDLLAYQKEAAVLQAATVAKVTALRLETEQAFAVARTERAAARQLREENERLRAQAAIWDLQHGGGAPFGELSSEALWAHIAEARAQARQQARPCPIALILLRAPHAGPAARQATLPLQREPAATGTLVGALRSTDRWTIPAPGAVLLALALCDADQADQAAARLRAAVAAPSGSPDVRVAEVEVRLFDAATVDDLDTLIQRVDDLRYRLPDETALFTTTLGIHLLDDEDRQRVNAGALEQTLVAQLLNNQRSRLAERLH